jgi:outer membrane lipoprotein-sorting protein
MLNKRRETTMKKIISLILCLLMLFSSVCTTAFADDTYEFFEKRQAINGYSAEAPAEYVMPSEIGGKVVESVEVEEGAREAELPERVVRRLDARKKLIVTVAPTSWFGDPEYEYSTKFTLERQ